MHDRLNFFEPWEGIPANHENQLTRALLVVLRYCPIAHQAWLLLVDPRRTLLSLPHPTFDTQRAKILSNERQPEIGEPIKGISVFCEADNPSGTPGEIQESDRGQILDGIIRYGDDVVVVLESKIGGLNDDRQAKNINLYGQPVDFDGPIRKISWRNVLASFTDLAQEERGLISGAERILVTDFLDFVDTNFPKLGPFNTLERCAGEPFRVQRRLGAILRDVLSNDDYDLPGTHAAVATAYLEYLKPPERQVALAMYPADTLQQARALYVRPNVVERIVKLETEGWTVLPNFHFGFMAKGFCWTKPEMPLVEYLRYWQKNVGTTTKIERHDWNEYWVDLMKTKIAGPNDREQFEVDFTNTKRNSASPRPGLVCRFVWNLDEAERLDGRGQFAKTVKQRINELLEAVGEIPIGGE